MEPGEGERSKDKGLRVWGRGLRMVGVLGNITEVIGSFDLCRTEDMLLEPVTTGVTGIFLLVFYISLSAFGF